MDEKHCPHCDTDKPVSEFHKHPRDGIQSYCKDCQRVLERSNKRRKQKMKRYREDRLNRPYNVEHVMRWLGLRGKDY